MWPLMIAVGAGLAALASLEGRSRRQKRLPAPSFLASLFSPSPFAPVKNRERIVVKSVRIPDNGVMRDATRYSPGRWEPAPWAAVAWYRPEWDAEVFEFVPHPKAEGKVALEAIEWSEARPKTPAHLSGSRLYRDDKCDSQLAWRYPTGKRPGCFVISVDFDEESYLVEFFHEPMRPVPRALPTPPPTVAPSPPPTVAPSPPPKPTPVGANTSDAPRKKSEVKENATPRQPDAPPDKRSELEREFEQYKGELSELRSLHNKLDASDLNEEDKKALEKLLEQRAKDAGAKNIKKKGQPDYFTPTR